MKAPLLALGLLLSGLTAFSADMTLTNGRTFHDATIVSQTPRKVVIKHADGLSGIEKNLLPAELAARYPVDEAAAREAERLALEARVRAQEFHKSEAERSARIRLEREQTTLHNAQIAALEAAQQRLAEAEAARIANQRTEVVYEYASFHRSPRYVYGYTRSHSRDCEPPHWNEKSRDNRFDRNERRPRHDRASDTDCRNPRLNLNNTQARHHTHSPATAPRNSPAQVEEEEIKPIKVAAVVLRR